MDKQTDIRVWDAGIHTGGRQGVAFEQAGYIGEQRGRVNRRSGLMGSISAKSFQLESPERLHQLPVPEPLS